MNIEQMTVGWEVKEVKQETRDGVNLGILIGYGATWDLDRGDAFGTRDRFVKGAFSDSILEHVMKRRQVRMLNQHNTLIGGFPVGDIKQDDRGLFVIGEVNLDVPEGAAVYALAKQGVLTDFSVGFSVDEFEMDGNVRTISKATLWEISTVGEPMNEQAQITQVKNKNGDEVNLYEADHVKDWKKKDFQKALLEGAQFTEGATKAIISLNIWTGKDQEEDDDEIEEGEKTYYGIDEIKDWTERDIEKALRAGAKFSKSATKKVMSVLAKLEIEPEPEVIDQKALGDILDELKGIKKHLAPKSAY